jgi:membrane-bound lytic murein transglycosylase D
MTLIRPIVLALLFCITYVAIAQKQVVNPSDLMEPNGAMWRAYQLQKQLAKPMRSNAPHKIKIACEIPEIEIAKQMIEGAEIMKEVDLDSAFIPDVNFYEVKDRLSCIEQEIPLECNDVIIRFVDFFTIRRRDYTRTMLERQGYYFPIFEQYLAKHNMPDELKYLSVIESGLNPNAVSRAGAVGLWQFMPTTGKEMGLKQDWYIDERRDPHKATDAACRYLKRLYNMFHDWELALAAYNCGPGYVRRALKKVPDMGRQPTFWEVYPHLPKETRSYVPQFVAAMYALKYATQHNIKADTAIGIAEIDSIMVHNTPISLPKLASKIFVREEEVRFLNPELVRGVLPAKPTPYYIRIPAYAKPYFNQDSAAIIQYASTAVAPSPYKNVSLSPKATSGKKVTHTVKKGEYIGTIATKYGVTVQQIKQWNGVNSALRVGQKLTIYAKKLSVAENETQVTVPTHLVQKGDTLWSIAKKYNISVEDLRRINNLKDENIQPGQKLTVKI